MNTALSLHELQRQFMAALYDARDPGPLPCIAGNGLEPDARLQIYRRSCSETHIAALRTTYPAVLALVGAAFFDQTARGYRRAYPSTSGNLQEFGAAFAEYLETLQVCRSLAYLPDVARLEWLRQQTVLAPESRALSSDKLANGLAAAGTVRLVLQPSVHWLVSRYAVLTIWRYAMQPTPGRLTPDAGGECVALWRDGGDVAITALDTASFACLVALARGSSLEDAGRLAVAADPDFALDECIESLFQHRLIAGVRPRTAPCPDAAICR